MPESARGDEMPELFSDQILFRISFGVAALIFEVILFVMLLVLGHGQRDNNMKYRTLVILVIAGILSSILDNLFRVSKVIGSPELFQVFLQLAVLVLNVYLSYYVFMYIGTFVKGEIRRPWKHVNKIIVGGSTAYAVFLFIRAAMQISSGAGTAEVSNIGRIVIGYAVEIYFLLFSLILVFIFRKRFEKRAMITIMAAYTAIISTIILQLFETRGLQINYFGAVIGSYIFYICAEIPDHRNLKKSMDVVMTLAEAIDAKDTYTKGHSHRVADYSKEIAKRSGMPDSVQNEIYMMAVLHDVGKIGVPDTVINKKGRLTDDEFSLIKTHPATGSRILEKIEEMPGLAAGAHWHHERIDGRGYPDGLKGDEIPVEARIIAVADAYDAMTSNRSYRDVMPQEKVREQIERGLGTQFDPAFGRIMLEMIDEDREYRMREM